MRIDTDGKVTVSKLELKALLAFAYVPDGPNDRPQIAAIQFDCQKGRVITTDCHTMAILTDQGGAAGEKFCMGADSARELLKLMKAKSEATIELLPTGGVSVVVDGTWSKTVDNGSGCKVEYPKHDAFFVPYEQVMVERPLEGSVAAGCVAFNPRYLARLVDVQKAVEAEQPKVKLARGAVRHLPMVDCFFQPSGDPLHPARFEMGAWVVIIMPARGEETDEWAKKAKADTREAAKKAARLIELESIVAAFEKAERVRNVGHAKALKAGVKG